MKEFNWKNAEGLNLYGENWQVENPVAIIALVHGQGEHLGRYQHLARWFNARNIAVVAFDQQGYGKSEGVRGHAANLEVLLDDIGQFVEGTIQRHPGIPVFLYGHSMGGHLALNYTLRRKPQIAGLIVTAPWIRLAFEQPAIKVMAGRLLRRFMPNLTLPTGLAANFISRDPAVVKAYVNDPLVHARVSASAGISLLEGADWLNQYAGEMPVSALVMHGTGDKLTSAPATKALVGRLTGDVTHREWPGFYHEIHNEPEQEQVFEFTYNWLKTKLV